MTNYWRISVAYRLFGTSLGYRLMSFVGFLSVTGLALAVAVLVIVLSVVNGFDRELREKVLGALPQGGLYARSEGFDWLRLREDVLLHPEVIGAAPGVEGSGIAINEGRLKGVQFRGIDTELESTISNLPSYVAEEGLQKLAVQKFGALLGAELANELEVRANEEITLVLPNLKYTLGGPSLTTRRLKVVGVFQVGADLDKHMIILRLEDAIKLKRQSNVDSLNLRFTDLFEAPRILHELSQRSSEDIFGVSWMRQNGNLYDAIQTQKATMFLLLMVLVSVAAFNLVSNLVMTVDDNQSEIAILKTMGATHRDILIVFIVHGLMVCLSGLLLGFFVGIALTSSLSGLYDYVSEALSLNLMSEYFIRYLPTDIRVKDLGAIGLFSLIICFLATIYPASKAAKTNPVEILVHEH